MRAKLEPPQGEAKIRELHRQDEGTKWFGVIKNSRHSTRFEDTGRYTELIAESRPTSGAVRTPQLVLSLPIPVEFTMLLATQEEVY